MTITYNYVLWNCLPEVPDKVYISLWTVITDQLMPLVLLLIITKYTLGFGQKFILSNSALLIEASSKRGKKHLFWTFREKDEIDDNVLELSKIVSKHFFNGKEKPDKDDILKGTFYALLFKS